MPFVTQERRTALEILRRDLDGKDLHSAMFPPLDAGDWCYYYYKTMVDTWRADPRWRTADRIYRSLWNDETPILATKTARELAWQVFFQLHVMPYELKKREENGDI